MIINYYKFKQKQIVIIIYKLGSFCCIDDEKNREQNLLNQKKEGILKTPEISMKKIGLNRKKESNNIINFDDLTIKPGDFIRKKICITNFYKQIGDYIGEGNYGRILKMKHLKTDEIRACKVINKNRVQTGFSEDDIINEIEILKSVEHMNIIKIFEFFSDEQNYYIITEYCEKGDLFDNLDKLEINEFLISVIIKQIFSAIKYLNFKNIFHGDLKLENILIDNSKKIHYNHSDLTYITIKLIDFGCSKIFQSNRKYNEVIGTIYYSSPEVLNNNYNEKCDIWSIGVIMYLLISGKMPFQGNDLEAIKNNILDKNYKIDFDIPEIKGKYSYESIDLMKKLLVYDPSKRICANEASSHIWFKNVNNSEQHLVSKTMTKNVLLHLKNYHHEFKFQLAVMTFITHNMGKNEEVNKLKLVFNKIDKDNDGKISKEELKNTLKEHLGTLAANEADLIFKELGIAVNDGIEYEDFLRVTLHRNKILTEKNLKEAFDLFDVNNEGSICSEGLKKVLGGEREVSDLAIREFLSEINKNPTERINFNDFMNLMYDRIKERNSIMLNNSKDSYNNSNSNENLSSLEIVIYETK